MATPTCFRLLAFVDPLLQPGDGFDVVPSSQFVVGRTAFKDNSSYYTVNGKKMAFREVSVLLKEAGIDLDHNRFLILQVFSYLSSISSAQSHGWFLVCREK